MRRFCLVAVLLIISYFFLYKIYIPRVSAFGCFDDCFNFAAGYFIDHGKSLYSEIFYNHQMLPAYISSAVQSLSHPINIFDLILKHRQFLIATAFIFNFFLVLRFGIPAFLFFIFFEFTKFYIFGDRFLAEGILVYPLTYLVFTAWQKLQKNKLTDYDYIASGLLTWLVVFLREVFAPLALVLFLFIIFPLKKNQKIKNLTIILFLLLTAGSLLTVNIKDYYFELVTVNNTFFSQGLDLPKIFFYQIYIFTNTKWNLFWIILAGINLIFLLSIIYLAGYKRKLKYFLIFIPLILANLRAVEPGRLFYDSFHMVPFYGIFLAITFLLINEIKKYNFKGWIFLMSVSIILFIYYIFSPQVFFREKVNSYEEFFTNYSNILQIGEIVKKISKPSDKLFVDGYDEVVYWAADRPSPYKYSMYTSFMPNFPIYSDARLLMFKNSPPDFYYGSCPKEKSLQRLISPQFMNQYVRLNSFGKPSCVFVRKDKLKDITAAQWKSANDFGYELPIDSERNF